MDGQTLLTYLATAGGAGAAASLVLEWIPQFQNLTSDGKRLVSLGVTILLGIAAMLALNYFPAAWWQVIKPYGELTVAVVLSYGGSQVFHKTVNKQ